MIHVPRRGRLSPSFHASERKGPCGTSWIIEQGQLKVIVDKVYPFAEIGGSLAYVENGRVKGKIVVKMS